jgi:hypothetical protein
MRIPVLAVDRVPETSGFSGFLLFGPAGFDVASNLIVEGSPLLSDVGNTRFDSIFDRPSTHSAPAMFLAGEVNYTFAGTRTQLFLGNRLKDFLRLDLTFGAGVRQELPDESVLVFSVLQTPAEMKVWSDPYVEGVDRVATDRHVFEPTVRYLNLDLDGAAMAVDGPRVQLTYLYLTPKLVLDAVLIYGTQESDTVHPVYGEALDVRRTGVAVVAFYDLFKKARWRAYASVDYFREDANIAFFDSKVKVLSIGAI